MKTILKASLVIIGLFNAACSIDTIDSEDVNQDAIYQSYHANYYESSNSTHISATFRVGGSTGTTIDLSSPSYVSANGEYLRDSHFLGTRYHRRLGRGHLQSVEVEFMDLQERMFVNTIPLKEIQITRVSRDLHVDEDYVIELSGPPLTNGEHIDVYIRQDQVDSDGYDYTAVVHASYRHSLNRIVLSHRQLRRLETGEAQLQVTRTKSGHLVSATREGGRFSGTYHLDDIRIDVTNPYNSNNNILVAAD